MNCSQTRQKDTRALLLPYEPGLPRRQALNPLCLLSVSVQISSRNAKRAKIPACSWGSELKIKSVLKQGMVAHVFAPSTEESGAGWSLGVQSQPGLHNKTLHNNNNNNSALVDSQSHIALFKTPSAPHMSTDMLHNARRGLLLLPISTRRAMHSSME